jgi:replicative DNA helicase
VGGAPVKRSPNDLARQLGVTLPSAEVNGKPQLCNALQSSTTSPDEVDLAAHPDVQAALDRVTGDRSSDTHRVVAACFDDCLDLAQTRAVVASRDDLAARLAKRPDDDVQTIWNKVVDDRQHQVLVTGSRTTRSAAPAPAAGPTYDTSTWQFIDGATFILDIPDTIPALWGDGNDVLWPEGESLMIAGPPGLGKTTLCNQVLRAQLGLGDGTVLGLPVPPRLGKILYLAMDRPAQIRRAAHRIFTEEEREMLAERVLFWKGPPPYDIAKSPGLLLALAEEAGAQTVYLDSVKDAAIGLSEDEVGAGYNRARQRLLANGVQLAEQHHTVKRSPGGGPPVNIADIYGSAWITNGTGSIVLLTGEPGDPIVGFRHVRSPANEIGPWRLLHDQAAGTLTVDLDAMDLVKIAGACGADGLTAKAAAEVLFETDTPSRAQIEKGRRNLEQLARDGRLVCVEGGRGGSGATRKPSAWFPTAAR